MECNEPAEQRAVWRLHNFFLPSVKLLAKERIASKTIRRYDFPKTPCQQGIYPKTMTFGTDLSVTALLAFILDHGYAFLFAWVFLEQIGLPIPAAPMLLAAGALAGYGKLNFVFIFLVVWSASLICDLIWYFLGKYRGGKVIPFLCRISLSPDFCVGRTKALFDRQGVRSLLVAKFLPGVNTITPPLAGIYRMSLIRFIFWDTLGIVLWVIVLAGLGHQFRHQLEWIARQVMELGNRVGAVILVLLSGYIAIKYWQRRRVIGKIPRLRISPREVKEKLENDETPVILDVRSALDVRENPNYIPGALHLPMDKLPRDYSRIPRDREIVIYCA